MGMGNVVYFCLMCNLVFLSGCMPQLQSSDQIAVEEPISLFFDDKVEAIGRLPCVQTGESDLKEGVQASFWCSGGDWQEVMLRLVQNTYGNTVAVKLFWRVYPAAHFYGSAQDTVKPFLDFVIMRYQPEARDDIYALIAEKSTNRIVRGAMIFEHTVTILADGEQHALIVTKNNK